MRKVPSGIVPLIRLDRRASEPLHRQIYSAYRSAILERRLRPNDRVPSTRTLASELGVSRIPVLNAYSQLLAEGYFESRVGAGTVVSRTLPDQITAAQQRVLPGRVNPKPRPVSRACSTVPSLERVLPWLASHWGAFTLGEPAVNEFPFKVWSRLVVRRSRNLHLGAMRYCDPMGLKGLREAIAAYVRTARGVNCESEQVLIVSGSQQALQIASRVLLDPGDHIWMEEPGYRFARYVFNLHGLKIVAVPVDDEGLNVAAGIRKCRNARAVLITPSHQYPLGVTMSASRRLQLLEWANRAGSWIIEDDYDSEYRYDSMPIASLQGLDPYSRVVYIGTFSKVMFPSLRLGYLVVPPDLVERFLAVRFTSDISPPTFLQGVMAEFICEGHFSRHIRRMRSLYHSRRSALLDSLKTELGVAINVAGEQAGMHLSVTLPKGFRDQEVAERAARQRLWLAPLSVYYQQSPVQQGFVLGFSSIPAEGMSRAVRRLRGVLHAA